VAESFRLTRLILLIVRSCFSGWKVNPRFHIQHKAFSVLIAPRRVSRRFGAHVIGANHQ
jgi:hypothetical protein